MRQILTLILLVVSIGISSAQCKEDIYGKSLEKNMIIFSWLDDEVIDGSPQRTFTAEITSVEGDSFSCRFLHTQSRYKFKNLRVKSGASPYQMQAEVKSNKGGRFPEGTMFTFNVYVDDPEDCTIANEQNESIHHVIATFPDNKRFLAKLQKNENGFTLKFSHSNSVYTTDKDFKVLSQEGGGYPIGSQIKVVNARVLNFQEEIPPLLQERN